MGPVIKAFLLLAGLLVSMATGACLYVWNSGVSALDEPSTLETLFAGSVRDLAVGRRARDIRNPMQRTPEIIAAGRAHFADHCAICHANDGSGQTTMGRGLYPKPPDMRLADTQELSDGELFYIIEKGVRLTGMPGWSTGEPSGEEASWHLVHFMRHLPELSEPELEEMQRLNPAPPEEIRHRMLEEQFLQGGPEPPAAPPLSPHKHEGGDQ